MTSKCPWTLGYFFDLVAWSRQGLSCCLAPFPSSGVPPCPSLGGSGALDPCCLLRLGGLVKTFPVFELHTLAFFWQRNLPRCAQPLQTMPFFLLSFVRISIFAVWPARPLPTSCATSCSSSGTFFGRGRGLRPFPSYIAASYMEESP